MIPKRVQFFNQWAAATRVRWSESGVPDCPVLPWITPEVHPELLEFLSRFGIQKTFSENESVIPAGVPPEDLVILESGLSARVFGQTRDNMAVSVPYRVALGNLNFFSGLPCYGKYFALTACSARFISQKTLRKVLASDSRLFSLFSMQCELINLSDRIGLGLFPTLKLEERLTALYVSWAMTYGRLEVPHGETEPWITVPDAITRGMIQSILSASAGSVDKTLRSWAVRDVWRHEEFLVRIRPSLLTPVWSRMTQMAGRGTECDAAREMIALIESRGEIPERLAA